MSIIISVYTIHMPALTHGRVINGFNLFPRQTKGYYQQFPPNVNGRKRVDNFRESQCTGCDKRLCCGRPLQPFKLQLSSCGKGRCRVPTGNESRKRALTCGGVGSRNFAAKRAIGRRVEARNRRNCDPCCCCLPTVTWSKPRNRCLGSCSRPSHPPTPAPTPSGPEIIPTSDALQAAVNAWFSGTPGDKQAVIDKYGDISVWRFADAVTDMSDLFLFLPIGAPFNEDISAWDVSHVTTMEAMFRDSNFNGDISSWQVGNVTNMSGMFDGAIYFHQDISGWVLHDPVPSHFQMVQGANNGNFPCSKLPVVLQSGSDCVP